MGRRAVRSAWRHRLKPRWLVAWFEAVITLVGFGTATMTGTEQAAADDKDPPSDGWSSDLGLPPHVPPVRPVTTVHRVDLSKHDVSHRHDGAAPPPAVHHPTPAPVVHLPPPPPSYRPPAQHHMQSSAELVAWLRAQVGKPYAWGGIGPYAYDCSGLTEAAYAHIGIRIPRVSEVQSLVGRHAPMSHLLPGDLLFWGTPGAAWHVAIYIGNGQFIGSQNSRTGVVVRSLAYDMPSFARRIL